MCVCFMYMLYVYVSVTMLCVYVSMITLHVYVSVMDQFKNEPWKFNASLTYYTIRKYGSTFYVGMGRVHIKVVQFAIFTLHIIAPFRNVEVTLLCMIAR